MRDMQTAPAKVARMSMRRRPKRSARAPQKGAAMPMLMAVEKEKSATHMARAAESVTPRSTWRK